MNPNNYSNRTAKLFTRWMTATLVAMAFLSANVVNAQVSVTATAGTAGPTSYTTVSAAFAAINAGTHQGAITIRIVSNTSEPGSPTALLKSASPSNYSSVLITPFGGNYTIGGTITASRAIIELNGADNVTIDGDDPTVLGTRNLTIGFASTAATAAACIRVSSNSTVGADGANGNVIKNCIITGNRSSASTTATYGINMSNYSTTSLTTGGYSSINNRFENNLITRCYHGIWAVGASATYPNTGLQIVNNVFGDNTLAGNIGNRAIIMSYSATTEAQAAIIRGNEVVGVGDPGTTGYAATIAGIELGTVNFGAKIYNNYVHDVKQPSTSGYGAYGVLFSGSTSCDSMRFYNNIVTRITASNYTTTALSSFTNYGVKLTAGTTFGDFSNNTIVLSTANPTGTATTNPISYALSADVNGVRWTNFRNNIIVNSIASTNAIGIYTNNNAIFTASNYAGGQIWDRNCYWVPTGILGYYAATAQATFSAWKTASGKDAASFNVSPSFVSASDLHINGSVASLLESGGMATSFNTDYDGQARPGPAGSVNGGATNFDIGADEFDGIPITPVSITSASATANSCTAIAHTVTATIVQGTNPITSVTLSYTLNGVAQTPISMTNTSGNTWTATIPAATPTNATIAWTITAVDAVASPTASSSYQDDALFGIGLTASATPTSVCTGTNTSLLVTGYNAGAAPTSYTIQAVTNPTTDEDLGNVTITDAATSTVLLNNTSAINTLVGTLGTATGTAGSYASYLTLATVPMTAGATYNYSLTALQSATAYNNGMAIYIDLNRDGDYADAGEGVFVEAATGLGGRTITGSFTLPATANNGLTRMRVMINEGLVTSPTMAISYGEREEYLVNISSANNGGGGNIPTFTYNWSDGSTSVGTANPLSTPVAAPTTYTVTASTSAGCTTTASVAVATIALPAAPTATNSVQCGPGFPTASVASNTGLATPQFRWYAAATGGSPLQSGTNTTYGTSISTTTTLYVSEFDGTCESARTPVTITVNTPPSITPSGPATICSGNSATMFVLSSNPGYAYSWSGGGGTGATVTVSPLTTTTYTVTALDTTTGQANSGCTISATNVITVNASPVGITVTATPSTVCQGASSTLSAVGGFNSGAYIQGALNTVNSTTGYPAPFTNYYGGTKTQLLFTVAELSALGYQANDLITSLGFAVSAVGSTFTGTLNNFTIAMKHTSATALTTTFETGLTQVASLNWSVPTTGLPIFTYVTFPTPFVWNGTSNLVIQTSYSNANSGTSTDYVQTYLTNTGSNLCSYYRVDAATAATVLAATTATVTTNRPDVRLGWQRSGVFSWSPTPGSTTSITVTPSSTTAYTVTSTNAAGCTSTGAATVTVNQNPTASATATNVTCNGAGNGSVAFSATNGTAPYSFTFNGTAATSPVTGIAPGTYTVVATDANGCTNSTTAAVTQPAVLSLSASSSAPSCYNSTDASITFSASGGTTPYSFTLNGTAATSPVSGLAPGTYAVVVTDFNNCTASQSLTISAPAAPTVSATASAVNCFGGSSTLNATAGFASYVWSGPNSFSASTQSATATDAGSYSVLATTAAGCTATGSATVSIPSQLTASATGNDPLCNGGSTTVTVSASGGTPNYTGTGTFTVAAGTHSYTVTDANGCTASASITLGQPDAITVTATASDVLCYGGTTSVSVSATGGTGTLTGTGSFTSSAGTQSFTVTDANGCTGSGSVTINQPSSAVSATATPASTTVCTGATTAVVVAAAGGTAPYTGEGSFTQGVGNQSYTVTDANGCTASASATITVSTNTITASAGSNGSISDAGVNTVNCGTDKSFTITPDACYSIADVLVNGTSVGAVSSYTFTNVTADQTISASFSIITYSVTASASAGGTISASSTVNCGDGASYTATADPGFQLDELVINGTSTTYPPGTQTATYSFSNVTANQTIVANFSAATCLTPATATAPATASVCAGQAYTLNGTIGGAATIGIWNTSGTGSFDNTAYGTGTIYTPSAADIAAGTVTITLTTDDPDGAGSCVAASASTVVTINAAPSVSISGTLSYCAGGSTTLTASGASSYVWSSNETTASITATAGSYSVVGTGSNGCTASASATVSENALPSAPTISASGSTALCDGGSVTLTSSYTGGNVWSNSATTDAITVSTAGSYSVTYTDGNGCQATSVATTVTVNSLPSVSIIGSTVYCAGSSTTLTAGGADTYEWSDNSTGATLSVSAAGTYSVIGTDVNGCTNSASTSVTENAVPTASITGTASICAGASSTLSANATAGSGTITGYAWSLNGSAISGATSATYTATAGGDYAVTVSNSNGCSSTSALFALTVNALPAAPTVSASGATTFCTGGSVDLTSSYTGGNVWSNSATTDAITVSASGNYSVTYTDGNGCSATSAATAVTVNTSSATISGVLGICSGATTTLTATASPAAVSYLWSDGSTNSTLVVSTPGTYSVTTTDANGCTAVASATTFDGTFTATITSNCANYLVGNQAQLTANASVAGSYTYLWNNGSTNATRNANNANTYSVTLTNGSGCTATASFTLTGAILNGAYTINSAAGNTCGQFNSLANAISHLNAYGMNGSVTLNLPAGYTETAPAGGFQLKMCALASNLQSGPTQTLTIQKSGSGANPALTAYVGTSTTVDGVFVITGADNVTIDGIDVYESTANRATAATATTRMEWGYAILKCTGNDGANDVTIKNSRVSLTKAYVSNNGIYVGNHDNLSTAGFTNSTYATTAQAARNKATIINNTLDSCYNGIRLGANPNVVAATGECLNDSLMNISNNTISFFGGAATTAAGIQFANNRGITVRGNTISSNTVATSTTAYGIYAQSGTWATIAQNTVQNIVSSSTFYGIYHSLAGGDATNPNIVRIDSNIFQGFAPSGTGGSNYGIYGSSTGGTSAQVSVSYNQFRNNTYGSTVTGAMYGFYNFLSGTNMVFNCNYNIVSGNTLQSSNTFYGIYGYATSGTYNCRYNTIRNNILSPSSGTSYILYTSSSNETHVDYNNITNNRRNVLSTATSVGTTYGIYALGGSSTIAGSCNNNVIDTLYVTAVPGTVTSLIYGLYFSNTSVAGTTVNNNIVRNITTQGTSTGNQTIYASYFAPSGTSNTIKGNRIARIGTTTSTTGISTDAQLGGSMNGFIVGAQLAGSTTAGITKFFEGNTFNSLVAGGSNGIARGLYATTGTDWYIYNNAFSRISAPFASPTTAPTVSSSTTVTTGLAVYGIDIANASAGYNYYLYNNSVYLTGNGGGANFATSGIHANITPNVTLVNNLVINLMNSGSSQASVAYRRSGAISATYQAASDNNLFYAGTPGATKLIYGEAVGATTNSKQTLADFKTYVSPRDAASRTETSTPFVAAATDSLLHIAASPATFVESGGKPYPSPALTTDIDGQTRSTTAPDIGADEGNFTGLLPTITSLTASPASGGCSAVSHTVTAVTGGSTVTAATLNYSYNGTAQPAITMTNTVGTTWEGTIPAATPSNAIVTWSVTVVEGTGLTASQSGASYQDAYLTGASITAAVSPTTVCAGSALSLNAYVASAGPAPTTYGASGATTTVDEEILNVTFKSINQTSSCGTLAPGAGSTAYQYSNYTGVTAPLVVPGEIVPFSVQIGTCGGSYANRSVIYIDWNRDGDFLDADETAASEAASVTGAHTWTGTIVVPASTVAGYTRMRVITVETSSLQPPTGTFSWGETEDYTIQLASSSGYTFSWSDGSSVIATSSGSYSPAAAGTYSYTVTGTDANGCSLVSAPASITVNPLPLAPIASNSLQCGSGIPPITLVSGAGTASPTFVWVNAAITTYYTNDFSTGLNGATLSGSASQTGGLIQLTPDAASQLGGLTIPASGINSDRYRVAFKIATNKAANVGADGMSYSFGDDADATSTSPAAENGSGSKLQLCFDSYDASGAGVMGIRLKYGTSIANPGSTPGTNNVLAYSSNTAWANTTSTGGMAVVLDIDSLGRASVSLNGSAIFTNVQLPSSYLSANKATWKHVFAGRTGGASQIHSVDSLTIQQTSVVSGGATYPTAISATTTFYVYEVASSGCVSPGTTVTAAVTSPVPVTASSDVATICPGGTVAISANTAAANNYTFTWYRKLGSGSYSLLLPAASFSDVLVLPGTYTYSVAAYDATSQCATSATTTVTVTAPPSITAIGASPASACAGSTVTLTATTTMIGSGPQTQPTGYTNPSFSSTADEEIFNVTLGTINNTSNCASLATGAGSVLSSYNNYTTTVAPATLTVGATYNASITIGYCATGTYSNMACMFIDWNRDGDFVDAGETVYTKPYGTAALGGTAFPFTVTVPATASAGVTRMRVVVNESSVAPTPTQTGSWGEGEDYLVNVLGYIQGAGSYTWAWTDGVSNVGSTNVVTVNPSASTTYTVTATDPATGCTNSGTAFASINPVPAAPTAVNSSQCGAKVPTCSVVGDGTPGATYLWYTTATGGTPIAGETGSSLSAYIVSTTTTLYVAQVNPGTPSCEGARVAVNIDVTQPDPIAATVSSGPYCMNGTLSLSVANTASTPANTYTYDWSVSSTNAGLTSTTGSSVSATPTAPGTYSFTVTAFDATQQCSNVAIQTVTFNANPVIDSINVIPSGSVCSGTSISLNAYTVGSGPQTEPTGYANPSFSSTADEEIFNVTLGTINNTSNCSSVAAGAGSVLSSYNNYTTTVAPATLTVGATYNASITIGYCATGTYSNMACMFIDWNRDGDFVDAGETVYTKPYGTAALGGTAFPFTVTVPATASAGVTRMRVVVNESSVAPTPTQTGSWGEGEDYLVNILALSTGGNTWAWTPGGMTGNSVTANPTATTTYTVTATNAAGCTTTRTVSKTVLPLPAAPTAVNNTVCGFSAANVSVTSNSGAASPVFQWYLDAVGGSPIPGQSGASLSGYFLSAEDTFYVSESDGTCSSARTMVIQSVTQPDAITASASVTSFCLPGVAVDLTATQTGSTNSYTYSWTAVPPVGSGLSGVQLGPVTTLFSNDFSNSTLPSNVTVSGNASITGGVLQITPNALSQNGAVKITAGGNAADTISVSFDLIVPQNGADGISYSYSDDGVTSVDPLMNAENGTGSKLKVAFVAYNAGIIPVGGTTAGLPGIYLMYNCSINEQNASSAGVLAYSSNVSWRASATPKQVSFTVGSTGLLNLSLNGSPIFTNVQLPAAYVAANKSSWHHIFKARTGGVSEEHSIDNMVVSVAQIQSTPTSGQNLTVTPTVAGTYTYYVTATDGFCSTQSYVSVVANAPATPVNAGPDVSICDGSSVVLSLSGGGGGTGSSGLPTGYPGLATSPGSTADEQIFGVQFGSLSNIQTETCASNYTDYSSTIAPVVVVPGSTVNFTVRQNECDGTTYYSNGLSIFIDWNRDGDWADAGEQAFTTTATTAATAASPGGDNVRSGTITVPVTASTGLTKMRVIVAESVVSPAFNQAFTYGEQEDYAIMIGDPNAYTWNSIPAGFTATGFAPTFGPITQQTSFVATYNNGTCQSYDTVVVTPVSTPAAPSITSNRDSICISGAAIYTATGITQGSTLMWQYYNTATSTWTNLDSTRSQFYTPSIAPVLGDTTLYYRIASFCGTNASYSNIDTLQIVKPFISSTVNDTVCGIGQLDLAAYGNGTMSWYQTSNSTAVLSTGNTYSVNTLSNVVYWVRASVGTCLDPAGRQPVFGIVNPAPPITTSPDVTLCENLSTTMTASSPADTNGYYTYTWLPGNFVGSSYTVTPSATTVYTVIATSANGCGSYGAVTVTVNSRPILQSASASASTICQGTSTTLNSTWGLQTGPQTTPGGGYCIPTQSGDPYVSTVVFNTLNSTVPTPASPYYTSYAPTGTNTTNVIPGATYTLQLTTTGTTYASSIISVWFDWNRNGTFEASEWVQPWTSANSGSVSVTVPSNAAVGLTGMRVRSRGNGNTNGAVDACTGFGSGSTVDYMINVVGYPASVVWTPGNLSGASVTVSPSASTTYTVTATSYSGCTQTGTVDVTVLPFNNPVTITPSATTVCAPATITLTAGSYDNYLWSTGETTQSITVAASGSYSVTASNNNGCSGSTSQSVTVNPFTSPVISSSLQTICTGADQAVLSVTTPYAAYSWSTGETTATITVLDTGTYTVTTTTAQGCTGTGSFTLTGSPAPIPPVINDADVITYCWDGVTPGSYLLIADGWGQTVSWNDPGGSTDEYVFLNVGSGPGDYGVGSHTIIITASSPGGCTAADTVQFVVVANPAPSISSSATSICDGGSVTLDAGSGYASYAWSDGSTGQSITVTPSVTTTYTVSVSNAQGCSGTASQMITVTPLTSNTTTESACDSYVWTVTGQTYTASGTYSSVNGCHTEILSLTITPSTSSSTSVIACDTYTWTVNNQTYTASGTYVATTGCQTDTLELTINTCNTGITLNLTAFIEGYYIGTGAMQPVLANQGVAGAIGTETDTLMVELRDSLDPTIVVDAQPMLLMADGTASATFSSASAGTSYWIAVRHRNTVQTWSAAPVQTSATTSYDFTSAASQAFGDNMKEVEPGVWAFFTGDINQDEFVDPYDYPDYALDNVTFASGYLSTDLNGDGFVDPYDYPVFAQNSVNFVMSMHP